MKAFWSEKFFEAAEPKHCSWLSEFKFGESCMIIKDNDEENFYLFKKKTHQFLEKKKLIFD